MLKQKLLFILSSFLYLFPIIALAEDSVSIAKDLKEIKTQLSKQESDLNKLKDNEKQLQIAGEKVQTELTTLAQRKQGLSETMKQLQYDLDKLEKESNILNQDLEKQKKGFKDRFIAIYKMKKRSTGLSYLFGSKSFSEFLKRIRYLKDIIKYDRNYVQGLAKVILKYEDSKRKLSDLQRLKEKSLVQTSQIEEEQLRKKEEKEKLLVQEKERIKLQEDSIVKLKEKTKELEKILSRLMGGVETEADKKLPDTGFGKLKGKLSFPVRGKIIQKFGKQKHEEYSDVLFVKGLEISAAIGSRVKAIAPGKVVLSQILPGYGNVIIIDHGQRYYSLYGRIATSLKVVGDMVKDREDLAILGETDYKGRNFYFELRKQGKAIDPLEFFKDLP